ncbi:holin-like protein [Rhizobium leguminosarum]|uniref:CidA/LrgA family protein n=1 Tax=Rhizobium leguminosarum TaxID=384 RepID=UPI00161E3B86|nr:CidA/LrgA family protein [Rhizobium leguminosarum]MBB4388564.1 holin-like protein [Rhizobium leguminosarum]
MIVGIATLLTFQLVGEILAYKMGGLVPGPVLGMALIAIALLTMAMWQRVQSAQTQTIDTSKAILANLGILFVPAGVGIVKHIDILVAHGLALLALIVVSTVITLAVTVWSFVLAKRIFGGAADE